jgi:periplasmic divalent cation tolerance protein
LGLGAWGLRLGAWELGPDIHFVVVLTTLPVDRDVDQFAQMLVREKLAACVNVLPPMQSIYSWRGTIEKSEERQVVIKTSSGRVRDLEARVKALHPYEVPEFIVIPIIEGSHDYLSWISESTSN